MPVMQSVRLTLKPGGPKSGHAVPLKLERSHHLAGGIGVLRLGQNLHPAEKSPLSTGTGSGLSVLRCIEVTTTTAPEDDEH